MPGWRYGMNTGALGCFEEWGKKVVDDVEQGTGYVSVSQSETRLLAG